MELINWTQRVLAEAQYSCMRLGGAACAYLGKDLGFVLRNETSSSPVAPILNSSWRSPSTHLFISISSYRDPLCPNTLYYLFTKAKYPERIRIALVQQNGEGDIDCVEAYCAKFTDGTCHHKDNIDVRRLSAADSQGPTWARAIGSSMLQDEEFCLQIDSHMDFTEHWDVSMMEMWAATNNEYAILSTYVADADTFHAVEHTGKGVSGLNEVPHLCMMSFAGSGGMPRNWGTKCLRSYPSPKLTNGIWGAGLSFSKCHAERKVPYDPHTPGIFDGEEMNRAVRFWTYGYDIYTPHRIYISHYYKQSQSDPNHMSWMYGDATRAMAVRESQLRLRSLFHMSRGYSNSTELEALWRSKYGLGDRRTFRQFEEFSGIDFAATRMTSNRCGNIDLVPFTPHPLGADYIPQFDPVTEAPLDVPDIGSIYYDPTKHSSLVYSLRLPGNYSMLRGNSVVTQASETTLLQLIDLFVISVGVLVIVLVVRRLIYGSRAVADKAL